MATLQLDRPLVSEHGGTPMTPRRHRRRIVAVLAVAAVAGLSAGVVPHFANATAHHPQSLGAPTAGAPSGALTVDPSLANCGTTGCDLYARAGSVVAGSDPAVPIWGFTSDPVGPGFFGGNPLNTIIISEGQTLNLTLHNDLPGGAGDLSLELPAVQGLPDLVGAPVTGTKAYSFGPLAAGTYIYEAGATIEQPRQLAMGLAGLIIVRPADFNSSTPSDFATGLGGFDDEGLIVFNEVDPRFNENALTSDVEDFTPQYFFINGKAHPATDEIGANAGQTVLLRAANLGIRDRALGLVNGRMKVIADDSHPVVDPTTQLVDPNRFGDVESKLLTAGQVTDLTTLVAPSAHAGDQIPVLDLQRHLNNSDQTAGLGGMVTFIDVVSPAVVPGGPVAKITSVTPAVNDGSDDEVVGYTLSAGAANWFIDDINGPCTGAAGGSPLTLTFGMLSGGACAPYWTTGDHVVWIVPTTPGSPAGDVYTLALQGPSVSALTVDPQFANLTFNKTDANPPGSTDVILEGTAQPSMLNRTITHAEGCWTQPGGSTPCADVAISVADPVGPSHAQALHAVIPVASIPVANATNTLYVRVDESDGSTTRSSLWADPNDSVKIVKDLVGPSVTTITASPNPAGIGNYPGNLNFLESVRITADISDLLSPIADAELFVGTQDADGTGSKMRPLAGQWLDDLTVHGRTAYLEIPVAELQSHDQGPITIYVHGKDAAGNWGPTTSVQLMLDKTNPVIVGTPTASSTPCGVSFCNRYQAQDETGANVLTAGSIQVQAQDPPGSPTPVSQLTIPTGEVQIRYHVSSVQGVIGQAGAGIFYQTAQSALGTVVANNAGTYTINFDWHLVFPTPGPDVLPPEASTSVWVWVLDAAGNPSVPVEVPVGPPTNPTPVP
jgi:hypothetical protein